MALVIALVLVIAGIIVFQPRRGVVARLRRQRHREDHIVAEDVLKILFARSENNESTSLADLIALQQEDGVRGPRAIEQLRRDGLIRIGRNGVDLTRRGAAVAADLVRAHRLWELHLAEETGYDQREWHGRADAMEHRLVGESVEQLSRRLGSPVRDPDGDPIPAGGGVGTWIPAGQPIESVEVDTSYRITHLEDEPQEIYAQLVDRGVYFGMRFHLVRRDEEGFDLTCDGRHIEVPRVLAAGILVEPCKKLEEGSRRLADLAVGDHAVVLGITAQGRGAERQRFLDLGFVPGARVDVEFRSAGKNPTAYRIKSSLVALRHDQALKIRVRPFNEDLDPEKIAEPVVTRGEV